MSDELDIKLQVLSEDTTKNLVIEGDNLEVLRILQKAYAGRVKLIYIDPPYNTGSDLLYEDDFKEPVETYLEQTLQKDEGGFLTSNPKSGGRFHSKWLNMIYPRLKLAHSLLKESGFICISIDDNEVQNLKCVLNEIFGEENFLACVIWQKVYSERMDAQGYSSDHDYILVYQKLDDAKVIRINFEQNSKQFTEIDPISGRKYRPRNLRKEGKSSARSDRPKMFYEITAPDGTSIFPIRSDGSEGRWRWSKAKFELEKDGLVWLVTKNGWQAYVKQFLDSDASRPPTTLWLHEQVGHNHEGVDDAKKLFSESIFDNPKPVRLMKHILEISSDSEDDDIILDFFAGSGTTAQAVIEQNLADNSKRQFICVQIPVPTDDLSASRRLGFETIAEITKERLRRSLMQHKSEGASGDLGFRVLKLDRSNFVKWRSETAKNLDDLQRTQGQLALGGTLVPGWKLENVLTEIMLLNGFPLDSSIEQSPDFFENRVDIITHPELGSRLLVCLDRDPLGDSTVAAVRDEKYQKDVFVCLETALTDQIKARLADSIRIKTL